MISLLLACAITLTPPATTKSPVTDTYHGVTVTDDYRWLEDWSAPAVKEWSNAQNAHARSVLDALPAVDKVREKVTKIMSAQAISYSALHQAGATLFAIKRQPPKQQSMLVTLASANDLSSEKILLDPNTLDPKGLTSIDWFVPSFDGTLVAVSLSSGGSESGDVHVYNVATGKDTGEVVPRVNGGTAGGSLAWNKDGTGFFYTRYPRAGERPEADMDFYTQVYFHKLGTPTKDDVYELGRENPKAYLKIKPEHPKEWSLGRKSGFELTRIAEIMLSSDDDTGRVLCTVQHGDGGTFAIYVRDTNEIWRHIADYDDKVVQAAFGPGNTLFLISRQDAPRGKILSLELEGPALVEGVKAAKVFVPEGKDAIVSDFTDPSVLLCSPHALFVTYQLGGPNEIRVFDHYGHPAAAPAQLPIGDAGGMCVAGLKVLFNDTSYVHPQAWFEFDPGTGKTAETALKVSAPVDFDDCEVVREFATSKDGTKVPVNILRKKGIALDGSHPCLVTAYGGYGVNITPSFRSTLRVFMDEGFVWAQANIRGGAEYGEEWHRQGALLNKQNVFDDFYAACKFMVESKHTSPAKLAIEGGSNGGLLMGAALTQHPDAFRAVVSHVGIYDMLRVELSSNGAFNIPEFGTVKDEAQFKALYAYSPYHHVKDGAKYPSVIFLTGANDPRVDPMQSRKMTARLQAAGADALLRTSANSGHGGGTALSERIEQQVDVASWLFDRLGVSKK